MTASRPDMQEPRPRARWGGEFWRRYRRNRPAVIGLVVLVVVAGGAAVADFVPFGGWRITRDAFFLPSTEHPFGTDDLGRDIFTGILLGARVSLLIGVLATAIAVVIGVLVGSVAGYYARLLDDVLMRVTEFFQVVPIFILALVLVAIVGPSIWNLIFVIGVLSWPGTARLSRAEFLSLREREFVTAARALGVRTRSIMWREILPNASPPIIVNASLLVATAILLESGLSFLGLGDPALVSWGSMIGASRGFLRQAWWLPTFPGLAILVTVLSLNLVGDGLNDALNPRLRER